MILDGTQFPVLWPGGTGPQTELKRLGCPRSVPWSLLEPHEQQAKWNHGGQTLKRLAERGGLDPTEMLAVLEDRPWRTMEWPEAVPALLIKIQEAAQG
jgi:hypothetical protein